MAPEIPVSSTCTWIPEDDLLLKASIENALDITVFGKGLTEGSLTPARKLCERNYSKAGASLEALAKGAVKFSRRFTFHELRDRWHSLLYDPDVSAQASACMVEFELSSSNSSSKFSRLDNSKGNERGPEKRKIGSIRRQYYAMQKRIKSEMFNSTDLGFFDEPNLNNYSRHEHDFQEHVTLQNKAQVGGAMLGDCLANNLGLKETDFEILLQVFPETIGNIGITTAADSTANDFHAEGCHKSVEDDYLNRVRDDSLYKYPEDVSPLIRNGVRNSFEPDIEPKKEPNICKDDPDNFGNSMGIEEACPSQTLPNGKHFETESQMKLGSTNDSVNENNHILCSGFGGKQHFNSPGSDGNSASFHAMGFSSPLPRLPLWRTMEDVSAPDMPVNENNEERTQLAEETLTVPEDCDTRRKSPPGYDTAHADSLMRDRPDGSDFINSIAVLEGDFTDLPDSLLNFSNEDELLFMDVDGKDITDDNPNLQLLLSRKEVLEGVICNVEPKTSVVIANTSITIPSVPPAESKDTASSVLGDQRSVCHVEVDVPSTSVPYLDSLQLTQGSIICTLNTEDPEIPCNDDIFLLIHPSTSFASSVRQPIITDSIDPVSSSADEKDGELGLNFMTKGKDPAPPFKRSQMVEPNLLLEPVSVHPPVVCTFKSELPDTKCLALLPGQPNKVLRKPSQSRSTHAAPVTVADGVLEKDAPQVEFRGLDTIARCGQMSLHAEEGTGQMIAPESMANPSTSDQDEYESDGDIPYFSDIEAMILEMDLAYAQDSCISDEVSRYQYEDNRKTIIRLEQTADSSLRRAMTSQGALAILFGLHVKYYIKKTEVTIGRSTDDTDVDIDLRKEGRANKISRRQATIKMETDGSFSLKNLGKSSISVNGKAIGSGQVVALSSSCLIEIRGMSFMFEINDKYVRRYLDNLTKKSQDKNRTFEWSAKVEP